MWASLLFHRLMWSQLYSVVSWCDPGFILEPIYTEVCKPGFRIVCFCRDVVLVTGSSFNASSCPLSPVNMFPPSLCPWYMWSEFHSLISKCDQTFTLSPINLVPGVTYLQHVEPTLCDLDSCASCLRTWVGGCGFSSCTFMTNWEAKPLHHSWESKIALTFRFCPMTSLQPVSGLG